MEILKNENFNQYLHMPFEFIQQFLKHCRTNHNTITIKNVKLADVIKNDIPDTRKEIPL